MIIEWVASLLLGLVKTLIGVVLGLMPDFDYSGVFTVLGTAMQLNAFLPVSELMTVAGAMLTWRFAVGPVTAVLARWRLGVKLW